MATPFFSSQDQFLMATVMINDSTEDNIQHRDGDKVNFEGFGENKRIVQTLIGATIHSIQVKFPLGDIHSNVIGRLISKGIAKEVPHSSTYEILWIEEFEYSCVGGTCCEAGSTSVGHKMMLFSVKAPSLLNFFCNATVRRKSRQPFSPVPRLHLVENLAMITSHSQLSKWMALYQI
ncbi:hypothetical protein P8452_66475 [Trifolium repens]|nr:hypothetical protein P8452_66475 [Trifolium repens]